MGNDTRPVLDTSSRTTPKHDFCILCKHVLKVTRIQKSTDSRVQVHRHEDPSMQALKIPLTIILHMVSSLLCCDARRDGGSACARRSRATWLHRLSNLTHQHRPPADKRLLHTLSASRHAPRPPPPVDNRHEVRLGRQRQLLLSRLTGAGRPQRPGSVHDGEHWSSVNAFASPCARPPPPPRRRFSVAAPGSGQPISNVDGLSNREQLGLTSHLCKWLKTASVLPGAAACAMEMRSTARSGARSESNEGEGGSEYDGPSSEGKLSSAEVAQGAADHRRLLSQRLCAPTQSSVGPNRFEADRDSPRRHPRTSKTPVLCRLKLVSRP